MVEMMSRRGIRTRRGRRKLRKLNDTFGLQLTSMMDALVIIVVFLLKSYNVSTNSFTTAPGLHLPYSTSVEVPTDSLQIIVTTASMSVDQERVVDFVQNAGSLDQTGAAYAVKAADLDDGGRRIVPLFDALIKAKEKTELLFAKSKSRINGRPIEFEGIVAIQADQRIKYDTLRKIMYTAATAGFKSFRFLALKQET
jgi:biopolymer transport protein ExbD